ncbi:MAG: mechanosensitive ion channel family protein, partial [Eubacteriales bacterium]
YSKLTTVDNKEILIPNYLMAASKIVNYTANGCRRVDLKFTASYHAPTEQVKASIFKAISAVPEVRTDPPPEVHLWDLGDHGVTYVSRVWADTPDYWKVHFALMEGVRERFLLDGIEIPYRHLDVTVVEKPLNDG